MVFGIITATAAVPAIVGTTEEVLRSLSFLRHLLHGTNTRQAIRHGQKQNQREEHRGRKYHLHVTLLKRSVYTPRFEKAPIVLKDGKFYVDTRRDVRENEYYPATVNYLEFPGKKQIWRKAGYAMGEGLVTMINDERYLNWVYVDSNTHEVRYGVRKDAEPHVLGPWDQTKIEHRLTFQGWEGFIAVQEEDEDDLWALYFDIEDDGLTGSEHSIGNQRKRMLEVEVWRKEIRRDFQDAINERRERLEQREEHGHTVE